MLGRTSKIRDTTLPYEPEVILAIIKFHENWMFWHTGVLVKPQKRSAKV